MTIGDMLMRGERRDRRRKKSKDDKKDDGGLGSLGLILYASGAITQAMGTLLRMMHSRSAEYAADAFAKSIGAGADLASALEKLEASHATVRREDARPRGERVRGVVHRQPAGTRFVAVDDGRVAADASPERGSHQAVARLVAT